MTDLNPLDYKVKLIWLRTVISSFLYTTVKTLTKSTKEKRYYLHSNVFIINNYYIKSIRHLNDQDYLNF